MAVFLIIAILGVVLITISEAVQKYQDRKGWISGVEYDREVYGLAWITARVITDDEKEEFDVKYNPHDGHFYDRDNFGYHATEILLKRHEESGEV